MGEKFNKICEDEVPRKIHGWNDIPEGYIQEEDFHLAPLWLRALARTIYFEKYAYPMAVKKGLVSRWAIKPIESNPQTFWSEGIKYINSTYPGLEFGSPIFINLKKSRLLIPNTILVVFSFILSGLRFLAEVFTQPLRTRWGSQMRTSYFKAKIEAARQ